MFVERPTLSGEEMMALWGDAEGATGQKEHLQSVIVLGQVKEYHHSGLVIEGQIPGVWESTEENDGTNSSMSWSVHRTLVTTAG